MAFFILIRKIDEDSHKATYEFGPSENCLGNLSIDKQTGLTDQLVPVPVKKPENFFIRASTKLRQNWKNGQFPDKTSWES